MCWSTYTASSFRFILQKFAADKFGQYCEFQQFLILRAAPSSSHASTNSISSAPAQARFVSRPSMVSPPSNPHYSPLIDPSFLTHLSDFQTNIFMFPSMLLCFTDGLHEHQQIFHWNSSNFLKNTLTLICTKNILPKKPIMLSAETTTCVTDWFYCVLISSLTPIFWPYC